MNSLSNISLAILILSLVNFSSGFYFVKDAQTNDLTMLENLKLSIDEKYESFPNSLKLKFNVEDEEFDNEFTKINVEKSSTNVYKANEENVLYNHESEVDHEFEHYVQTNGQSIVTLIKNEEDSINKFRILGTIYSQKKENVAYDILPVNIEESNSEGIIIERITYNANNNHHAYRQRDIQSKAVQQNYKNEFVTSKMSKINNKLEASIMNAIHEKSKRQVPSTNKMLVEILIAVDDSTVALFTEMIRKILSSTDRNNIGLSLDNIAIAMIKVYYCHMIVQVNVIYENSFANDRDLKITVRLNSLLFLDKRQSMEIVVSDPGTPTHKGIAVVLDSKSLAAFKNFMNKLIMKNPSLHFDHASAMIYKDLWNEDKSGKDRSGTLGIAYVSGICTDSRYSVCEERANFAIIHIFAHELAHNLGSEHDGSSKALSCPETDSFVMAPTTAKHKPLNQYFFSSCTIRQIKELLLTSQNKPSEHAQCLIVEFTVDADISLIMQNLIKGVGLMCPAKHQCQSKNKDSYFTSNKKFHGDKMCTEVWCSTINNPLSSNTDGEAALQRTVCGSGKSCQNGLCKTDAMVPIFPAIFGDFMVYQLPGINLPKPAITCPDAFNLMIQQGVPITVFCDNEDYEKQCPLSCLKHKALKVKDTIWECGKFAQRPNGCNIMLTTGEKIKDLCPRSCKQGNITPVTCTEMRSLCINGATCTVSDKPTADFNFKCVCKPGYTGEFCEKRDPCSSNPCTGGKKCFLFCSDGYFCA